MNSSVNLSNAKNASTRTKTKRPAKPYDEYPLCPDSGGTWIKKVNGRKYCFGSWKSDPTGKLALQNWLDRKDAIYAGVDDQRRAAARDARAVELENRGKNRRTVSDLLELFTQDRAAKMKAQSITPASYRDIVACTTRFADFVGTSTPLVALSASKLSEYATSIAHLSCQYRKKLLAYASGMLRFGSGEHDLPMPKLPPSWKAPDTTPAAVRQEKERRGIADNSKRLFTGAEIDAMLSVADTQWKAIILLGANTGLGPSDVGRLRWRHINFETGELDFARPKTGQPRRAYLWRRTRRALLKLRRFFHQQQAIERHGDDALVFWTRGGRPLYEEKPIPGTSKIFVSHVFTTKFGGLVRKARLPDGGKLPAGASFYRLRHGVESHGQRALDQQGVNLLMGHSEKGTMRVYNHHDIELRRLKRIALKIMYAYWPKAESAKVANGQEVTG